MKKTTKPEFSVFLQELTERDRALVDAFFSEFHLHFLLSKRDTKLFKADFESTIMLLYRQGVPMPEILSRLALSNLEERIKE